MTLNPKAQQIVDDLNQLDYENPVIDEIQIQFWMKQHLKAFGQPDRPVEIYRTFGAAWDAVKEAGIAAEKESVDDPTWALAWQNLDEKISSMVWALVANNKWVYAERIGAKAARFGLIDRAKNLAWDLVKEVNWNPKIARNWNAVGAISWDSVRALKIANALPNCADFLAPFEALHHALMSGAFLYWITKEKVIVLTRPIVPLDDNGRLHSLTQPAVKWSDEECFYFLHGTQYDRPSKPIPIEAQ